MRVLAAVRILGRHGPQLRARIVTAVRDAAAHLAPCRRSAMNLRRARFPHHARPEPRIAERVDQRLDHLPPLRGFRFGKSAASTAVVSDRPLIRCAAQSAEISLQLMPQTFSV